MNIDRILAYELRGNRIAVYKVKDENHILGAYAVTNTWTGKALICLSIEQALDTFDFCIEALHGNNFLN